MAAGAWVVNLYKVSDNELLAFIHVEHPTYVSGSFNPGKGAIALGWSSNGGETFTYLGEILKNQPLHDVYNMQGAPYVIKDGYFYLFYHDLCPGAITTAARAPVNEVISSARQGRLIPWKKYYQGSWTSNGLGGPCTPLKIDPGIDHTDSFYSTYTKKYYLLLSRIGPPSDRLTWIRLYESSDLVNWTLVKKIVEETVNQAGTGYQYVSVIDTKGTDNGFVDRSFYVYSAKNFTNASLYRWAVTFADEKIPGDLTDHGDTADDQVNLLDYNELVANFGNPYTLADYNSLVANFHK